ncbi:MAG: GNAT family N-acetyltransferase [Lachnospiraceae bacterium]|nr:GNAT family N-acetyltransferase [Lachnospiraceae bacterium]
MKTLIYENLPDAAKIVRQAVFVNEQGFQHEFDPIDDTAVHIVIFNENDVPIATCRIFWDETMNMYILGRLAVMKKYRGKSIGSVMIKEAEKYVKKMGQKTISLHAQCQAAGFYQKLGFIEFGNIENDEGCPHIWMKKNI